MSSESTICKIMFGIRIINANAKDLCTIKAKIKDSYKEINGKNFSIKYQDADNDLVEVVNDEDF